MKKQLVGLALLLAISLAAGIGFGWWRNKGSRINPVPIASDVNLVLDSKTSPPWSKISTCNWIDALDAIYKPNMESIESDLISGINDKNVSVRGRVTMGYALQLISGSRQAATPGAGVDSSWCIGRSALYNALIDRDYTSAIDYLRTTIALMNSGKAENWQTAVAKLQAAGWDIRSEEISLLNESVQP